MTNPLRAIRRWYRNRTLKPVAVDPELQAIRDAYRHEVIEAAGNARIALRELEEDTIEQVRSRMFEEFQREINEKPSLYIDGKPMDIESIDTETGVVRLKGVNPFWQWGNEDNSE